MLALGWLASAIGAIAGMMMCAIVYLDPNMMSGILLYALAAAVLGGIDSPVVQCSVAHLAVVENVSSLRRRQLNLSSPLH